MSKTAHSEAAMVRANARYKICQAWDKLLEDYAARGERLSLNTASRKLGVPLKSLWNYGRLWHRSGRDFNALIPSFHNSGTPKFKREE